MINTVSRKAKRQKRARHLRGKISGTAERPRLCIAVTNRYVSVQLVDDNNGTSLLAASTADKVQNGRNTVADAQSLGKRVAGTMKEKGISRIVFDRSGFKFHGRVKALAEAIKEDGIRF